VSAARGLLRRGARTIDWLLFTLYLAGGAIDVATTDKREGSVALNLIPIAIAAFAVLQRRRAPLAMGLLWVVAMSVQATFLTSPEELVLPFFGLMLLPYAAGAYAETARSAIVPAAAAILVAIVEATGPDFILGDILFPAIFTFVAWLTGRTVRSRTRLAAELHEAAVLAVEEEEAEAVRAVGEERRRIAREMHDIVAHSISVMVVQAGGARRILDRDPDRAVRAAEQIERTGRGALVEMRRLLGLLQPAEGRAERAPQPSLEALHRLVARAREAGLPVEVHEEGERRSLPAGLDLAAYRIVQEALTNALKHAGAAPTEVTLRWSESDLELEITDRGPGRPAAADKGHGIVGMRERVRLYGGRLHTGPRRGGGFEVRATLPLSSVPIDQEIHA
jgi:signal transduction histidine kinase